MLSNCLWRYGSVALLWHYGPSQVKCWLLNYDILLSNEFPTYFESWFTAFPKICWKFKSVFFIVSRWEMIFGSCQNIFEQIFHSIFLHFYQQHFWKCQSKASCKGREGVRGGAGWATALPKICLTKGKNLYFHKYTKYLVISASLRPTKKKILTPSLYISKYLTWNQFEILS